ncbi:MAG TPA: hypothetical protein V6C81_18750 [Planktothrix sp.]|jgi:membrane protein YdbS with pleckstrin-like domain
MNKEAQEAEKAEFIQSVKALLIPLSLFLACVIMAAGTFLIYNGESCGWGFVAVAGTTVIIAFVALIRFQNKYRARGIIKAEPDDEVVVAQPARAVRLNAAPTSAVSPAEQAEAPATRSAQPVASVIGPAPQPTVTAVE